MNKLKKALAVTLSLAMIFALCACSSNSDTASEDIENQSSITLTDTEGREITLDSVPERVVTIGSALRLYTYIAGVDKVVGVENVQRQGEGEARPYFMAYPEIADIPMVGEGKNAAPDAELLLNTNPDVIFAGNTMDVGSIDELQSKIGVPIIMIDDGGDGSIANEKITTSLELIGKAMGMEERAAEVTGFLWTCENDLEERTADIPEEARPTMYVGALSWAGHHGLESTMAQSPLLNSINANNVANEVDANGTFDVDMEQILEWDPEYIIIDSAGLTLVEDDYKENPKFYNSLQAFQNGNVYLQLGFTANYHNPGTAIADSYFIGSVLYPEAFSDIDPAVKADEIYEFLVGAPVYEQMAALEGGFGKITLG